MLTVSMECEIALFMTHDAGTTEVEKDFAESKAIAITALEIDVFRQMVHSGS